MRLTEDPCVSNSLPGKAISCLHTQPDLLRTLFSLLERNAIRYCVLHSWEGLPEREITSDLDLAVDRNDFHKLISVFDSLSTEGYEVVQCIEYEVNAYCFIIAWLEETQVRSLALDIISEQWVNGLVLPNKESIIRGRRLHTEFWIASAEVEFTYLLAKRVSKGYVGNAQRERLRVLANELGRDTVFHVAKEITFGVWMSVLADACFSGDFSRIRSIQKRMWIAGLLKHPFAFGRYTLQNLARLFRRWRHPTGVFVAVLGPDGAGKSTLIGNLAVVLRSIFRDEDLFHWRPSLIRHRHCEQTLCDWTQPPQPRGRWVSIAVLLGVAIDNWAGYLFVIRKELAQTRLVLFDRCYHDLLVDPIRYRYGGPMWIAKHLGQFIPRPELLIVLDAPQEVVFRRKQESGLKNLEQQRSHYAQLVRGEPRSMLVNGDQDPELVCAEAANGILLLLAQRFRTRYPQWCSGRTDSQSIAAA